MPSLSWTPDPGNPYHRPAQQVGELFFLGAIVRLDPTDGIYVHTDDKHYSKGIEAVSVDSSGRLRINHENPGPIFGQMIAQGDETITGLRGILVGPSGGGGAATTLTLYDTKLGRDLDLNNPSDYSRVAGSYANVWFALVKQAPVTPAGA